MKRTALMRKTPLRRVSLDKKPAKKKKSSRAEMLRSYGVPPTATLRYTSNIYKGIYWYWLARYTRLRDAQTYGTCISCGKEKVFEELQAGHFAPAGTCGFALVFDPTNINGECGYCNGHDEAHLWGYARNLDLRYGKGTAQGLQKRYDARHLTTTKEWGTEEYKRRIGEIRASYEALTD